MENRKALVTGADRGLGYCLVQELLQRGYIVYAGKFLENYQLLEKLNDQYPETLHIVRLDMESEESIRAAYREVCLTTDSLDLFISDAAYMEGPPSSDFQGELPIDTALMEKSLQVNALGPLICVNVFFPLLERGEQKRLCFVSSEVSSIYLSNRTNGFRYLMSKTALNMAVRMMHNSLFVKGYTFRLYQPGYMRRMQPDGSLMSRSERQIDPQYAAAIAMGQFLNDKPDEQRLEMMCYNGLGWPF